MSKKISLSRGGSVFAPIVLIPRTSRASDVPPYPNDIFLHALFARLTLSNNETIEFETKFNQATNTIELIVPPDSLQYFNQLTGIQRGPNFKTFINWLIGSETLTSAKDLDFVNASELLVWFGATPVLTDAGRLMLSLPAKEPSTVGHNLKTGDSYAGSIIWAFIGGLNSAFEIRSSATVSDTTGATPVVTVNDSNISTFNLLPGDIRETVILNISDVGPNNIINILLNRNFVGNTEPQTEGIGIIGLRVKLN